MSHDPSIQAPAPRQSAPGRLRVPPILRGADRLGSASILLALIGMLDSIYLIFIKLAPTSPFCMGIGDCETVNTSVYSEFMGIPIAVFGALGYAAILGVLLLEPRLGFFREYARLLVFGMALAGTAYSAYLTYIELAVLHKICPYCVVSAVVMTVIFILSIVRMKDWVREE